MAKSLSMRAEHVYVLECDQEEQARIAARPPGERTEFAPTRWVFRRQTAAERWDVKDQFFQVDNMMRGASEGVPDTIQIKQGWRERYLLNSCMLRVDRFEDADKPGTFLEYPGIHADEAAKLKFWDAVPASWLTELSEAISDASEVDAELSGNSAGSLPTSSGSGPSSRSTKQTGAPA